MNTRSDKYTSFRSTGIRPAQCGFLCSFLLLSGLGPVRASIPPAPTILAPTTGQNVQVPFTNTWIPVTDSDGVVAYSWQVSLDPEFVEVIYQNSTFPGVTNDVWSGLAPGVYYWRVQGADPALIQGPWSAAQSFTVTGATAAEPSAPTLSPPQGYTTFHPDEGQFWTWTGVPGAATYTFELSQDTNFPLAAAASSFLAVGSATNASFAVGNPSGTYFMRVRAVSSNGYRSVPSNVQVVTVSDSNPIPAPPEPVAPTNGAVVTFPVDLVWTSVPNPQPGGYTVEISSNANFSTLGAVGSDITDNSIPLTTIGPGTWFWEIYSSVGDVNTAFSTAGNFTISSAPPEVVSIEPGLEDPTNMPSGGFNFLVVQLSTPTSATNTNVEITSSDTNALPVPATLSMPAGTANNGFNVTAGFVSTPTPVTVTASYGGTSASLIINVLPPTLASMSEESFGGGTTFASGGEPVLMGLTLNGSAGPNGAVVSLSSSSPLVSVPATVTVPANSSSQTFDISAGNVTTNTPVTITATFNGSSIQEQIVLAPQPPPATISLCPSNLPNSGSFSCGGRMTIAQPVSYPVAYTIEASNTNEVSITPGFFLSQNSTNGAIGSINVAATNVTMNVTISIIGGGVTQSTVLTINGPSEPVPTLITFNPSTIVGGLTSTGFVSISAPAPSGGLPITVTPSQTGITVVPSTVIVPEGETNSSTFTLETPETSFTTTTSIAAGNNCNFAFGAVTITPPFVGPYITSFLLNPITINGGSSSTGTVTLSGVAPSGGAVVALSSDSPSVTLPSSVTVPAGTNTISFTVIAGSASTTNTANLTATFAGVVAPAILTVLPGTGSGPTVSSLSLNPSSVTAGSTSTGTVTLSQAAPKGGAVVALSSGNTSVATVPGSVTVPPRATSATFTITTESVSSTTPVTISASFNGSTQGATLTVNPSSVSLSSLSLNPISVIGGTSSTGTVTLSGAAPSGGAVVTLSSGNTSVATVPNSVTVPAGATSANFTVSTRKVRALTSVTISGSYGGQDQSATLTVTTRK